MDALDGGALAVRRRLDPDGRRHLLRRHLRAPPAGAGRRQGRARAPQATQGPRCRSTLNRAAPRRWSTSSTRSAARSARRSRSSTSRRCGDVTSPRTMPLQDLLFAMMRRPRHPHPRQLPVLPDDRAHAEDIATIKSGLQGIGGRDAGGRIPAAARAGASAGRRRHRSRRCPTRASGATRTAQPAWFVPDPDAPGKYLKLEA